MIQTMEQLFRLPRRQKRIIQVMVDIILLAGSFLGAMMLRLDNWSPIFEWNTWFALTVTAPITILIFIWLGFYRAVIRYISLKALQVVLAGVAVSAIALGITSHLLGLVHPITVPSIYAMLGLLTVGGIRFFLRGIYLHSLMRHKTRIVIYGAGAAGSHLATSLSHGCEYVPVAFIDDWRGMHGTLVEGLKVYSPNDLPRLVAYYGVDRILLAMPSTTRARRREILRSLETLPIPVQTIPGMDDVVSGRARINEIRDIAIEDLLGRDPIPPNQALLDANIRGKVVMVTGAGGSIGSELCRQIITQQPRYLVLVEVCEYALYSIENELRQLIQSQNLTISIKALLGSVQQRPRMEALIRTFQVQTIYHAAAYKHVPIVEHNVVEGIRNNVYGTLEIARAAIDCNVETFVLVSTDKAVRPTNVMGTTKRLAELICQALANHQQTTRFCMVRFGNVLGSSGSVVPLFYQQIKAGGPITVTHPEITRYFMTIPEAAQLVIQAGAMGRGGDVFVLDMGEPVKIAELARQMIRLSGLEMITEDNPGGDIAITYSGLRPGEKLYEELLIGENVTQTVHPRIMTADETFWGWPELNAYLQQLYMAVSNAQHEWIRQLLQQAPTAYHPAGPIADLVWQECDVPAVRAIKPLRSSPTEQADMNTDLLKVSAVSLAKGGTHL
ncbi:hypothetical protein L861_02705 [Litchfieldella anticariensis FP35 = DSM 16096]|uniref:Polysaccharide biosynthesis protein CapD-like domain-containing protein n=1 Tax=Litchfieldella anticariensis (strain DSM 16096 / CECT 5854 / CIP 108499 / LMG 22089 / FP35) TaxID=1121939 RepID=S2L8S8_LITA3|nr:nucleoside-diphosphate sugar epimerase/dehydratase [Halomonas anticariensis]EPC04244.1 hypothetical protein L861_02705 [Halomonas anticariensis FP35 = DSM 16096]